MVYLAIGEVIMGKTSSDHAFKMVGLLLPICFSWAAFVLFLIFMILKLASVIEWHWGYVTAPLWGIPVLCAVGVCVGWLLDRLVLRVE